VELLEHQSADEDKRTLYLLRVARAERQHDVTFPLARITTCGTLTIEVLRTIHTDEGGQPEPIYGPPDATLLAKKGVSTAFTLLALLASQPGNFATKDWLSEKLGHLPKDEEEDGEGLKRVDNVVTLLRKLLSPPRPHESWDEQCLRRRLVAYQRASGESGPGYRLAGSPLLWLDVEEIGEHVKRARRLEQFGKDGLSEWRAAYDLAIQGLFLPNETYSDWAEWRRLEIEAHLWDSVQALWRRYAEQGDAGETEALRILRDYWLQHPTKEDTLRPLMELLGKREWYGQAEEYYEHLCTVLAVEGKEPDQRTRETMDFLRALQIQRRQTSRDDERKSTTVHHTQAILTRRQQGQPPSFSLSMRHDRMDAVCESVTPNRLLGQETQLPQDLESDTTVDRREATKHLGMLGLALFTTPQRLLDISQLTPPKFARIDKETLAHFGTLTETCLLLSEGSQLEIAERVLWSYLPEVEAIAQHSTKHRKLVAGITSQGYLVAASLVGHHNDLQARQHFSEQALLYADLAQDRTLQIAALRQLAVTFDYLGVPQKVLQTYEQALPHLDEVVPLLRACIYAALSGVYAQLQQKQESSHFISQAYKHLPAQHDNKSGILRLINARPHTVILWDGLNHLELNQPHLAEKTLAQLDVFNPKTSIPERIRIELLNYQAKAFAANGKKVQACNHLEQAFHAALRIGSRRRLQESFTVFQYVREIWPHEQKVQGLGDLFVQHLINHVH
jgi:DNA-binding SARP family transcriptional activator